MGGSNCFPDDIIQLVYNVLHRTHLACLIGALAWLLGGGGQGGKMMERKSEMKCSLPSISVKNFFFFLKKADSRARRGE